MKRVVVALLLVLVASSADAASSGPFVLRLPWLADVVRAIPPQAGGGGGGGGGITSGTTTITGGTNTRVLFNDSGVVGEDAGFTYVKGTDTLTVLGNLELGHATASTLSASAGILSVEGVAQVGVAGAQALTGEKTINDDVEFTFGTGNDASIQYDTTSTPDTLRIGLSVDSQSIEIVELADIDTNLSNGPCAGSACADPTLTLYADAANSSRWISMWHDSVNGRVQVGLGGLVGVRHAIDAITATETPNITNAGDESGKVYTNTGDTDGTTFTLPNDPTFGVHYTFAVTVAQTMTIVPSTGETLFYGSDQCLTSITSNSIGAVIQIFNATTGSGAVWFTRSATTAANFTCND